MANPPAPPSEPSLPELPQMLASEPELPEQVEERDSTPPAPPPPDRKLSPADEKLRAVSCAALMDPKVTRVMLAIVRDMGVRGSQVDDIVANIRDEIWEDFDLKADWPEDVGRWLAILREATKYKVLDVFRKHALRADVNVKVADRELEEIAVPVSSHRDRDDVREKAALIDQVKMPKEKGALLVDAKMAGKSLSAASRDAGMTATQGHDLWKSIEKQFKGAYAHRYGKAALKMAVAGGGAWMFVLWVNSHFDPFLWHEGGASMVQANVTDPPTIRQDATQLAAAALAAADAACDAGEWKDCKHATQLANQYDPDGNLTPQLVRLAGLADDGIVDKINMANAKTGQPQKPKVPKGK